jgi:hypothetical protein
MLDEPDVVSLMVLTVHCKPSSELAYSGIDVVTSACVCASLATVHLRLAIVHLRLFRAATCAFLCAVSTFLTSPGGFTGFCCYAWQH